MGIQDQIHDYMTDIRMGSWAPPANTIYGDVIQAFFVIQHFMDNKGWYRCRERDRRRPNRGPLKPPTRWGNESLEGKKIRKKTCVDQNTRFVGSTVRMTEHLSTIYSSRDER